MVNPVSSVLVHDGRAPAVGGEAAPAESGDGLFGLLFAALGTVKEDGSLLRSGMPAAALPGDADASPELVEDGPVTAAPAQVESMAPVEWRPALVTANDQLPVTALASIQASDARVPASAMPTTAESLVATGEPGSTDSSVKARPPEGQATRLNSASSAPAPGATTWTAEAIRPIVPILPDTDSRLITDQPAVTRQDLPGMNGSNAGPSARADTIGIRDGAASVPIAGKPVLADLQGRLPKPVSVLAVGDNRGRLAITPSTDSPDALVTAAFSMTTAAAAVSPAPPTSPVAVPASPQALSDPILVAVQQGDQQIELTLEPAELGRLRIHLQVDGDQVNLQFQSANPLAREAIESALPRLREMLSDQGLQLGQTAVGDQGQGARRQPGESTAPAPGNGTPLDSDAGPMVGEPAAAAPARVLQGLIDLYA